MTKENKLESIKGLLKEKGEMKDITTPEIVEILIREDGKILWINIDGICQLRVCKIKELVLNDER